MAALSSDPIRTFEHSHEHLTRLALSIGHQVRDMGQSPSATTEAQKVELLASLETLRDELLGHFADEEEALFPFVRKAVPGKAAIVDRLENSHDTICGTVVRLAHLAAQDTSQLVALYERFESAYAQHSREERELFEGLARDLGGAERSELAVLLRGLS